MPIGNISIPDARVLLTEGDVTVVDIRDPESYGAGHIDTAVNVQDSNVQDFMADADRDRPLIVCCFHGISSQGAAEFFHRQGFEAVYSLEGGYEAWRVHPET
jgi:thiosulfate sulfurtransferase